MLGLYLGQAVMVEGFGLVFDEAKSFAMLFAQIGFHFFIDEFVADGDLSVHNFVINIIEQL